MLEDLAFRAIGLDIVVPSLCFWQPIHKASTPDASIFSDHVPNPSRDLPENSCGRKSSAARRYPDERLSCTASCCSAPPPASAAGIGHLSGSVQPLLWLPAGDRWIRLRCGGPSSRRSTGSAQRRCWDRRVACPHRWGLGLGIGWVSGQRIIVSLGSLKYQIY